jgi:hypothetical protein
VGASALADLGRYAEALALLHRWRPDPSKGTRSWDLRVRYVLADVLQKLGRTDDARETFQAILRHDSDAFDVRDRLEALGGPPQPAPRPKPAGKKPAAGRKPAPGKKPAARRKPAGKKPAVRRKPAAGRKRPPRGSGRSG